MAEERLTEEMQQLLLKMAYGYEIEEKEIIAGKNGKAERVRIIKKQILPDLRAFEKIERYKRLGIWKE